MINQILIWKLENTVIASKFHDKETNDGTFCENDGPLGPVVDYLKAYKERYPNAEVREATEKDFREVFIRSCTPDTD
jgi:hypothetical protein